MPFSDQLLHERSRPTRNLTLGSYRRHFLEQVLYSRRSETCFIRSIWPKHGFNESRTSSARIIRIVVPVCFKPSRPSRIYTGFRHFRCFRACFSVFIQGWRFFLFSGDLLRPTHLRIPVDYLSSGNAELIVEVSGARMDISPTVIIDHCEQYETGQIYCDVSTCADTIDFRLELDG